MAAAPRPGRAVAALAVAVLAVTAIAGASVLAPAAPARAQEGDAGRERTAELRFRVVDLGRRSAALDDSEQTTETGDRKTVTFAADVLFADDRSDLNLEARRRIDALADELVELGGRTITIEGHTDDRGDPASNQGLSERRAEAVRARFAVQLDDEFTLEADGYGETRPVAPNETAGGADDPEGRARNRRVVVSYSTE